MRSAAWQLPVVLLLGILVHGECRAADRPEGQIVVLVPQDDHPLNSKHLVAIDPATGQRKTVAANLIDSFDGGTTTKVRVSANGRFAAVNAQIAEGRAAPNVPTHLHLYDLQTGGHTVVYDRSNVAGHAFTPDNSKLVFHDTRRIYAYDIEEEVASLVMDRVRDDEIWVKNLIPAPDSKSVIFHASPQGFGEGPEGRLYALLGEKEIPRRAFRSPGELRVAMSGNRWLTTIDFTTERYDSHQLQFTDHEYGTTKRLADDVKYDSRIVVSPDEQHVLYTRASDGALINVEMATANSKVMARWGEAMSYSPDGTWVVFIDGNQELRIKNLEDEETKTLGVGAQPVWVPENSAQ